MAMRLFLLVAWLVAMPCILWGQQLAPSRLPVTVSDLVNKTFELTEIEEQRNTGNDVQQYFIFHADGRATFRDTKSNRVVSECPLGWRLVGDTLYMQPGSIRMEVEGKTQRIDREAIKQALIKVPWGYLLKRKQQLLLLREVK